MKRFIIRLILFLSPVLLIIICGEIRLRTINSYYKQKINGLKNTANDIQVLILGNSHAGNDCNPKYFSTPAFNMAFAWQNFYYDEKILEKELDNLPNLKYVILDVSYQSFYNSTASVRSYFYKYYYDIDPFQKVSYWKENLSHFLFLYEPVTAFQVMFTKNKKMSNGFETEDTTIRAYLNDNAGKMKVELWKDWCDHSGTAFEANKAILMNIIGMLQRKGIMPVLVSPILSSYCIKYLDKDISEKNLQLINQLVGQYHVPYFDLQSIDGFPDDDFLDMDHLNLNGSIKFTKILDSLIIHYH
jgi:hypothetical protein